MPLTEPGDSFVVGYQRAAQIDRRGNQKPICRIGIVEMMKLVRTACRTVAQRNGFNSWPVQKTFQPSLDGNVQTDVSFVHQQGYLPGCDRAHKDGSPTPPAMFDQRARRRPQAIIAAVQPERYVSVE